MRFHGGRPPPGVIDFSVPGNPLGPHPALHKLLEEAVREKVYATYPDYNYTRLRESLASFYGLDVNRIIVFNGAAEALSLAILALKPRAVVVAEPNFGDHHLHTLAARTPLLRIAMREEGNRYRLEPDDILSVPQRILRGSLVILSNPNNPTGYCTPSAHIEKLLEELPDDAMLVIDESFIDISPGCESATRIGDERLILVKSLTKSFAVHGLRIGYAYTTNKRVLYKLEAARQAWNVNSLAAHVFEKFLTAYAEEARAYLSNAQRVVEKGLQQLTAGLTKLGLLVYESSAPLLLVRHPKPHPAIQEKLVAHGVYVRDASSYPFLTPYHSRIAVKLPEENKKLIDAFYEVIER
ncbi:aminotransferase class I and II [Pyrolobus fumarii 1A]|uniref:Aminotransferase n=1 Tax=Pyrolobus fumarii (strain DSM 11204 / 1A) TaxID=694429 RepID=G0EGQ5_PYRF1|nr:histidinol-phosphate transaminase [Pyrolobus fumarii]AEM39203.1 aminotransferase class I and II [Pyrolobus fumarii 1A]